MLPPSSAGLTALHLQWCQSAHAGASVDLAICFSRGGLVLASCAHHNILWLLLIMSQYEIQCLLHHIAIHRKPSLLIHQSWTHCTASPMVPLYYVFTKSPFSGSNAVATPPPRALCHGTRRKSGKWKVCLDATCTPLLILCTSRSWR